MSSALRCFLCGEVGHATSECPRVVQKKEAFWGSNYGKSGGEDMDPALEAMLKGIGLNSGEEGVKKPNQTKSKRACFDYQKGTCFRGANCRFRHVMPEDIAFEQQQQRLANQRQQQLENSSRSSSKEMDGSISSHKKTRRGRRGRSKDSMDGSKHSSIDSDLRDRGRPSRSNSRESYTRSASKDSKSSKNSKESKDSRESLLTGMPVPGFPGMVMMPAKGMPSGQQKSKRACFDFQNGECFRGASCKFRHEMSSNFQEYEGEGPYYTQEGGYLAEDNNPSNGLDKEARGAHPGALYSYSPNGVHNAVHTAAAAAAAGSPSRNPNFVHVGPDRGMVLGQHQQQHTQMSPNNGYGGGHQVLQHSPGPSAPWPLPTYAHQQTYHQRMQLPMSPPSPPQQQQQIQQPPFSGYISNSRQLETTAPPGFHTSPAPPPSTNTPIQYSAPLPHRPIVATEPNADLLPRYKNNNNINNYNTSTRTSTNSTTTIFNKPQSIPNPSLPTLTNNSLQLHNDKQKQDVSHSWTCMKCFIMVGGKYCTNCGDTEPDFDLMVSGLINKVT
ncbi:hypothetical protein TrLO_g6277 [Triparma laevis f. longispina]|uniref:Zinc finger protein n=1 Tax=Triparma laevis f. longispina TaxID=1714387 RepID=A0A9W7FPQ1_9STRA|nr:hypothetical protein TrLO_g6277 [Triparma laevis f. longispina]